MSVMSELSMQQTEDREMTLFDTPETAPAVQPATTIPTAQPTPTAPTPPATPAPAEKTEEEKKREHEEAEAKRKAEWEAKKKAREDEIQLQWENAVNMPQDQLIDSSVKRLGPYRHGTGSTYSHWLSLPVGQGSAVPYNDCRCSAEPWRTDGC